MSGMCVIGVAGLAVMGQNFAINFAEKGFMTAVYNRTSSKVDDCLNKAKNEKVSNLHGFKNLCDFVS
jgi:6-phosphogluconate dehydrogenase